MSLELLPFPINDKIYGEPGFIEELFLNSRIKQALTDVIPWLDNQNALDLPEEFT